MVDLSKLEEDLTKYNPGGFPKTPSINAVPPPTPEGSVFEAVFRQEHTIANIIRQFSREMPAGEVTEGFSPIRFIPPQFYEYADRYASTVNEQQVNYISDQISRELRDKAIIAGQPWRAFGAGVAVNLVDLPGYLLPGGAIYNNASRGLNVARSALSVAGANVASSFLTESLLHKTQYARSVDESIMNTFSSALIGAAMGTVASTLLPRGIANAAVNEASDIYANGKPTNLIEYRADGTFTVKQKVPVPTKPTGGNTVGTRELTLSTKGSATTEVGTPAPKPGTPPEAPKGVEIFRQREGEVLSYEYLKESRTLANLGTFLPKAIALNPWLQLKTSEFGTSRAIADELFESGIGTNSTDIALNAAPRNLETMIKRNFAKYRTALLKVEDIFFAQRGLEGGALKKTGKYMEALLKNEQLPGLPADQFWLELSVAIRNNDVAGNPDVLRAKELVQRTILDPLRDEAISLGLLPPNVSVATANSYLTRIWNRDKIIEDRIGFEDLLFSYYEEVNKALQITLPKVEGFNLATKRATGLLAANEKIRAQVDASVGTVATDKATLSTTQKEIVKADARLAQTNEVINNKKSFLNSERANLEADIKDIKDESQGFIATETQRLNGEIEFLIDKKSKALRGAVQQGKTPTFVDRLTRRYDKDIATAQKELDSLTRKTNREATKEIAALNKKIQRITKEVELDITKLKAELVDIKTNKTELIKQSGKLQKNIESLNKKINELKSILNSQPDEVLTRAIELFQAEIEGMKWQEIMGQRAAHLLDTDGNWRAIANTDELRADVTQTVQNILSLGDDRLLNPILRGIVEGTPQPLKNRSLLLPDNVGQPFLVNDALTILQSYIGSMSSVVEITKFAKQRGFSDIGEARGAMKQAVRDEWYERSQGVTGEAAVKLKNQLDKDLKNIDASFDLAIGIYGTAPNSDEIWVQIARGFRKYNQMRLMGSMTLSALPDVGTLALRYGPYELIHEILMPFLKSAELRSLSKDHLQVLGFVVNSQIGMSIKTYADTAGLAVAKGKYGKLVDSLMQGFGNVTLFNFWNDWAQNLAGVSAEHFTIKPINLFFQTGKISQIEARRLARAGIGKEDYKYIYEQWKKHGKMVDGCYVSNAHKWDISTPENATAYERYAEAIIKEVRNTIIEPTLQDKPLALHSELGKTIFQFKSFGFAATNKIFMSVVQNRDDQNTIGGLMALLTMGAIGYVATSLARGNEPDLSFINLSKEAIDRSAILGIFSEFYNIANKVGLIPGEGATRYRSRGIAGALFGPTIGALEDISGFLRTVQQVSGGKPLTTKDVDALLRLMPYQNLFYAHQLSRAVARKAAVSLGVEEAPETKRSTK